MKKLSPYQIVLLIGALLFTFILLYNVHYNTTYHYFDPNKFLIILPTEKTYPFPYHTDEWQHIAQAKYLIDNKKLPFVNPYFVDKEPHTNLETGFHVFLAELFLFTKINWIENFGFLPAILIMINSFLIFVFVRHLTKNFYIALFSLLFFALFKNNVNFLGNWFFIPLTFSLIFIYAFFILFFVFLNKPNKKILLALLGILIVSFFIYPLSTIFVLLITILYFLLNKESFRKIYYLFKKANKYKKENFKKSIVILIILLAILLIILDGFIKFFNWNYLIFTNLWTPLGHNYDFLLLYGLIPLIFALIGIWQVFIKYNKIFLVWLIPSLFNIYLYLAYQFTLLIPYPRTVFYFFIGLAPLSGIGLYYLCNLVYKWINKLNFRFIKKLPNETFFTLGIFVFLIILPGYYTPLNDNLLLYHSIDFYDYDAINFIDNNFEDSKIILAPPFMSTAIYPISRNYIITAMDANLAGRNRTFYPNFMKQDCNSKIDLIKKHNIDIILTKNKIDCNKFELLYSNNKSFVYKKLKNEI